MKEKQTDICYAADICVLALLSNPARTQAQYYGCDAAGTWLCLQCFPMGTFLYRENISVE